MSVLPSSLIDALASRRSPWAAPLGPAEQARIEATLVGLADDVRVTVLSALADPDRALWGRGVLDGLSLARELGVRAVGMADEDVVELMSARGQRVGWAVLPFPAPADRWGARRDVERLLERLDQTFRGRPYVFYLRRRLPPGIDVDGIARAVHLWLSAVERGERHERHAVYEDGEIAFELTLAEGAAARTPRLLTVGPISALERLAEVDAELVELAVRVEESHGELPLVVGAVSDHAWRLPRGYVEQLLYGTADATHCLHTGDQPSAAPGYRAQFRPNGRSLFSDPVCRHLLSLWWLSPSATDPLGVASQSHTNPWARHEIELLPPGRRFALVEPLGASGQAVLGWLGEPAL